MQCERGLLPHLGTYGSGRFCSAKCARGFSSAEKRHEINEKVRKTLSKKFVDPHSDDVFRAAADQAKSWAHLLRLLSFPVAGNTHNHVKRRAELLAIDTTHIWKKLASVEDILTKTNRGYGIRLRTSLIKIGREYVCGICGQEPFWNGRPLTLQVDHINGDRFDHTPENLRFACPNCHTQTPTFGSKNRKRVATCLVTSLV